jgi:hypothetical protein
VRREQVAAAVFAFVLYLLVVGVAVVAALWFH